MSNETKSRHRDIEVGEKVMGWEKKHWDWAFTLPHYTRDITATYQMEERIQELDYIEEYCYQLRRITNMNWDAGVRLPQTWQLIHASPEDRCLAAIRTMEAMEKRK